MSNNKTIQLNMSFQDLSDNDEDDITDISFDTDRDDDFLPSASTQEEETIVGILDTARMELPEFEEDLPPIMAKIKEKKRLAHAQASAYNRQELELTANEYAMPSVTPRKKMKEKDNSFEDSLLADFELKEEVLDQPRDQPLPLQTTPMKQNTLSNIQQSLPTNNNMSKTMTTTTTTTTKKKTKLIHTTQLKLSQLELEVMERENEDLQYDKNVAKQAVNNLASEVERIDSIDRRATEAIEVEKKYEIELKNVLKDDRQATRNRIQERIQRKNDQIKETKMHKETNKEQLEDRVEHEIQIKKQHERELKEIVLHTREEAHDRLQARIQRKHSAVKKAHDDQEKQFGDKGIPELEQELLAAGQVRKRFEKELSQLREEFSMKEKEMTKIQEEFERLIAVERKEVLKHASAGQQDATKILAMKEEMQELHQIIATRKDVPDDVQELKDRLEHASMENKRLQKIVQDKESERMKTEEIHKRNQRTWQVRLKAMQNKSTSLSPRKQQEREKEQQRQREKERERENADYQRAIFELQSQVSRLRLEQMDENRVSKQIGRAKHLLMQERRKRSRKFVVMHIGDILPGRHTVDNTMIMSDLHDSTHIIMKNVLFEMAATAMLEDTVGHDVGDTTAAVPLEHNLCGALVAGQHVRLGAIYGGWAILEAPFKGSWINISALGTNGIVSIEEASKKSSIFQKKHDVMMDGRQLKESRDNAAVLIHHVQAFEKLVKKGMSVLERTSTKINRSRISTLKSKSTSKSRPEQDTHRKSDLKYLKQIKHLFLDVQEEMANPKSRRRKMTKMNQQSHRHHNHSISAPALENVGGSLGLSGDSTLLASTGKDTFLRKQEQSGVWAVPPLELSKRTQARRKKAQAQMEMMSSQNTSEQLLYLFAKLHTAASTAATSTSTCTSTCTSTKEHNTWVNSKLPVRVFYVCTKVKHNNKGNVHSKMRSLQRRGIPEASVEVYHFPLDGNPSDLDAGTKVFDGQTDDSGRVSCRVSPGCYMIVVSLHHVPYGRGGRQRSRNENGDDEEDKEEDDKKKEKRRLIIVDPARGHLDKPSVVVPIEV